MPTTQIVVFYLADSGVLQFQAAAGTPPQASKLQVYSMLLQYNRLWDQSNGITMALEGADGEVVQNQALSLWKLDKDGLLFTISTFVNTLLIMRASIGTGFADEAPNVEQDSPADDGIEGIIRV